MSTTSGRAVSTRRTRAFTLLELLVAIVLTSVVALVVYSVMEAAVRTRERLSAASQSQQAIRAMRATLEDALRNARPSSRRGEPALVLDDRQDARGRPVDRLRFSTVGLLPPLTPGEDWMVTVEPTPAGLTLIAVPSGVRTPRSLVLGPLPGVTGFDVTVRQQRSDSASKARWSGGPALPHAIALTYWSDAGPVGTPLRVTLPLGGGIAR